MPTEPEDLEDEPETEKPVASVTTEPTDLKDEPETEDHAAPMITELTRPER